MKSHVTKEFREALEALPKDVQQRARAAYRLFSRNPSHPSLHFKLIRPAKQVYSVRIGRHYRALGIRYQDVIVWVWIGSHAEYDKLVAQL